MKTKEEIEYLAANLANPNACKTTNWIEGYTQCQEDAANDFLLLIEEYREKELPNRNVPYHYEAEISSGLNTLIEFIKNQKS